MMTINNIIVIVFIISTVSLLVVSYSEFSLNFFSAQIYILLLFIEMCFFNVCSNFIIRVVIAL